MGLERENLREVNINDRGSSQLITAKSRFTDAGSFDGYGQTSPFQRKSFPKVVDSQSDMCYKIIIVDIISKIIFQK